MTREEAISKHRKMWRWLAENPGKWKEDYLKKFDPEAELANYCYLCEYVHGITLAKANLRTGTFRNCRRCPIVWPGGKCYPEGPFARWLGAIWNGKHTLAAKLARQIAELPEK